MSAQQLRSVSHMVPESVFGRNREAENLVASSTTWRTGLELMYMMSIIIRSLNGTFSVPEETRNRVGAGCIRRHGSQRCEMS